MGMMAHTAESLSQLIGESIPDLYVVIAKNSIAGLDSTGIAEILGCGVEEIQQVEADQGYKNVRLILSTEYAKESVETDFTWDSIEHVALTKLYKRAQVENDSEFLLKLAAVANRAQRRHAVNKNQVLDPANGSARVALTLTRRLVTKLNNGQVAEETRQISVTDGSAKNPSFEDVDAMLGVSAKQPVFNGEMKITTSDADFSLDDIEGFIK